MRHPFKPNNRRIVKKQSTAIAPGIFIKPSKTREGCFLVLQVQSQCKPNITTNKQVVWDGSMQRAKVAMDFAAVEIAEYQHHMYGDEWDVQDLRRIVKETLRQFVENAGRNISKIKGR